MTKRKRRRKEIHNRKRNFFLFRRLIAAVYFGEEIEEKRDGGTAIHISFSRRGARYTAEHGCCFHRGPLSRCSLALNVRVRVFYSLQLRQGGVLPL